MVCRQLDPSEVVQAIASLLLPVHDSYLLGTEKANWQAESSSRSGKCAFYAVSTCDVTKNIIIRALIWQLVFNYGKPVFHWLQEKMWVYKSCSHDKQSTRQPLHRGKNNTSTLSNTNTIILIAKWIFAAIVQESGSLNAFLLDLSLDFWSSEWQLASEVLSFQPISLSWLEGSCFIPYTITDCHEENSGSFADNPFCTVAQR